MVFHVLNRGVVRMQLFEKAADYQAFERVVQDTIQVVPMRIWAYSAMPSHWHLLLWPERDGDLAAFMQRLTITHVRRWQENRRYVGLGHVYQGVISRFRLKKTITFWRWRGMWNETRCVPTWCCARRTGDGRVFGGVVVGVWRKRPSWRSAASESCLTRRPQRTMVRAECQTRRWKGG